eukprot:3595238-Rhodomonas_salina.1
MNLVALSLHTSEGLGRSRPWFNCAEEKGARRCASACAICYCTWLGGCTGRQGVETRRRPRCRAVSCADSHMPVA